MPTITVKKRELTRLLRKKLSDKELRKNINLIKPEVEEITDEEITYELNPDRPDLFSSPGLARAINGFLGVETGYPRYTISKNSFSVRVEEVKVRPYIACTIVEDLHLNEGTVQEIMNFQEALHKTIGRGRRKVAIGLHDFDKLHPPISYVPSPPTQEMLPLQASKTMTLREILATHPKGKEFGCIIENAEGYPTIFDQEGVFSFPPVINSKRTRITRNATNIFIDMTGTSLKAISETMNVLTTSLAERGGKIRGVDVKYPDQVFTFPELKSEEQTLDVDYVNKLIGMEFSPRKIVRTLEKMRYGAKVEEGKRIRVKIPPFRTDILHPVDIIEDICIGHHFDRFSPEASETSTIGKFLPMEAFADKVRESMIGLGFQEVMNPTLLSYEALTEKMLLDKEKIEAVKVSNPVSEEYEICRDRLLPSLLDFLSENTHVPLPQKVFELEDVILLDDASYMKTRNSKRLSAAISDHEVGYSDIRANLDGLLNQFSLNYEIHPVEEASFIPGRVGEIITQKGEREEVIGIIGEIHPQVLLNFALEAPVSAFEINIEELYQLSGIT